MKMASEAELILYTRKAAQDVQVAVEAVSAAQTVRLPFGMRIEAEG
jgi:hypothetical protein